MSTKLIKTLQSRRLNPGRKHNKHALNATLSIRHFISSTIALNNVNEHRLRKWYPVNSPTCKLAYANSPTPTGELAYVGEFVVPHSCVKCVVNCVSTCVSTFCSFIHCRAKQKVLDIVHKMLTESYKRHTLHE